MRTREEYDVGGFTVERGLTKIKYSVCDVRGRKLKAQRRSEAARNVGRFCQHTEARCVQENRRCALWSIDIPIIREVPSHLRQAAAAIFGQVLRLVEPFREVKEVLIRVLDVEVKTERVEQ